MTIALKASRIEEILASLYPETACFLHHRNDFQLLIAVILSAQATDKSVNEVTEKLFSLYPTSKELSQADYEEVLKIVKRVGLGPSKTKNIIATSIIIENECQGQVPPEREKLLQLPGVGYKTSAVVLGELFNHPYIPVDTHVERVSKRLGLVPQSYDPKQAEIRLEKIYKNSKSIELHRRFILLGRNICTARNPKCESCPLSQICAYHKKQQS